jgi:hypothetical protein
MSGPITWRNISIPDIGRSASHLIGGAQRSFNQGAEQLTGVIQDRQNRIETRNNDDFRDYLSSFRTEGDLAAAIQSGDVADRLAGYGGNINRELARTGASAQRQDIRDRFLADQAFADGQTARSRAERDYFLEREGTRLARTYDIENNPFYNQGDSIEGIAGVLDSMYGTDNVDPSLTKAAIKAVTDGLTIKDPKTGETRRIPVTPQMVGMALRGVPTSWWRPDRDLTSLLQDTVLGSEGLLNRLSEFDEYTHQYNSLHGIESRKGRTLGIPEHQLVNGTPATAPEAGPLAELSKYISRVVDESSAARSAPATGTERGRFYTPMLDYQPTVDAGRELFKFLSDLIPDDRATLSGQMGRRLRNGQ